MVRIRRAICLLACWPGLCIDAPLGPPGRHERGVEPCRCHPMPCSAKYAPELSEGEVQAGFDILDTNKDRQVGGQGPLLLIWHRCLS